ncbi:MULTISPECIES: rhodanese-like domain-containing protein [Halorussus]|uniref:rhodanese-like domain-containing protein n=1 Tax=Halorussus TaxID=1070314 RepID=UPI00209DB22D|nr:rhodanese-like domain-containing protein [Halorussus vallis]USZ74605.1 rhodanese-like domain-containing protein [Halorussus vallis]
MDGEISPEALNDLLEADEDVRVVDIRPRQQFERGRIPGSENIPFHALSRDIDSLDGAERVVTVCPHGKSSVQAARLVASYEGIPDDARVESMAGGLDAWEYDLETDGDDAEVGDDAAPDSPF